MKIIDIIQPMEPILSGNIPEGKGYLHQIKWDGIRGISYISNKNLKVLTKRGYDRSSFYPELLDILELLHAKEAVLDGEMVVFDEQGRPSFSNILIRERVKQAYKIPFYREKYPVSYIIFDLMWLDGKDLRSLPLLERKSLLTEKVDKSPVITMTDDFEDGSQLFQLMRNHHMEGIVSKKKNSIYSAGKRHTSWYKTKLHKKLLVVVGGLQFAGGRANAILVGILRNDQWEYIGNIAIGLKHQDFELLESYLPRLKAPVCPFTNIIKDNPSVVWLNPILTCWVSFMEWTSSGGLRHPKLLGFSKEKPQDADGKETSYDVLD